ncbi:MAG: tRNA (guanosine(37)-N1)-methyltransferase TrmD [Deferribacteres bacterium]|nr:tRNA (guanosine(37)-N1)-methyltransferase TrmD [candidate division KSB1 bacterium]MCB9510461.1 tRNA (guanosine(37)-N1)-methyltransferase TrmD [Deferribacteres bacterium]
MEFFIVSAFPDMFHGVLGESIIKRARESDKVAVTLFDLRNFSTDKHKTVDDYPFGGGPGMILKPEPIFDCVEHIVREFQLQQPRIVLTSATGRKFDQQYANELAAADARPMILICGHYKGVDERVREHLITEEISIGDYILTGGELAAMVIIDAVVRLLPGVIGDFDSALGDSFQTETLDCPHYTRPREYRGMEVPDVLLSGNHAKIEAWRRETALQLTMKHRPDLLQKMKNKNNEEKKNDEQN